MINYANDQGRQWDGFSSAGYLNECVVRHTAEAVGSIQICLHYALSEASLCDANARFVTFTTPYEVPTGLFILYKMVPSSYLFSRLSR